MDKKICNISSYNRKYSLLKTVESIYNQVDVINIALNSYDEIIGELIDDKINILVTDNKLGDAYKFYFLTNSDGYYLTIDDDLIYAPYYVQYMIDKVEQYDRESVITLHGRSFKNFPIESYYKDYSEYYRCLGLVDSDRPIQFGGTGVMCFHTNLFKLNIDYFLYPNMADVWVGKYCAENNIPIICAKHDSHIVTQQKTNETIYDTFANNDVIQTEVVNDLFIEKDVTIIIPTYKNMEYLDDTIDSITKSAEGLNFEILVGIDDCEATLEHIKSKKYNNFVSFYYFNENLGPYIIKNTLTKVSKSNKLIFFDSDDIMKIDMVPYILSNLLKFDCVKPMYLNFTEPFINERYDTILKSNDWGEGVFGINKEIFNKFNGFEGWKCSADSEFMARIQRNSIKIKWSESVLFYRRLHNDSLTRREDTGYGSELRRYYNQLSKNKTNFGPLSEMLTAEYTRIYPNIIYKFKTKPTKKSINTNLEHIKQSKLAEQALLRISKTKKVFFEKFTNTDYKGTNTEDIPISNETIKNVLEQVSSTFVQRIPKSNDEINKKRSIINNSAQKIIKDNQNSKIITKNITKRNKGFNF